MTDGQPLDPNAAVSPTQIAHAVNLRLQVFNKTGGTLCGIGLNTLLGFSGQIFDPRIQWNNLNNRFTMAVIPVPPRPPPPRRISVLASKTSSACGSWWVHNLSFSGPLYPAGTLLDYPYLGQDRRALLLSSNNFRRTATGGFTYINSAVFSINKAAVYAGAAVSFPAFAIGFSTAPVTVIGIAGTALTDWARGRTPTTAQTAGLRNDGHYGGICDDRRRDCSVDRAGSVAGARASPARHGRTFTR